MVEKTCDKCGRRERSDDGGDHIIRDRDFTYSSSDLCTNCYYELMKICIRWVASSGVVCKKCGMSTIDYIEIKKIDKKKEAKDPVENRSELLDLE